MLSWCQIGVVKGYCFTTAMPLGSALPLSACAFRHNLADSTAQPSAPVYKPGGMQALHESAIQKRVHSESAIWMTGAEPYPPLSCLW